MDFFWAVFAFFTYKKRIYGIAAVTSYYFSLQLKIVCDFRFRTFLLKKSKSTTKQPNLRRLRVRYGNEANTCKET